jgi:hypothetical protein
MSAPDADPYTPRPKNYAEWCALVEWRTAPQSKAPLRPPISWWKQPPARGCHVSMFRMKREQRVTKTRKQRMLLSMIGMYAWRPGPLTGVGVRPRRRVGAWRVAAVVMALSWTVVGVHPLSASATETLCLNGVGQFVQCVPGSTTGPVPTSPPSTVKPSPSSHFSAPKPPARPHASAPAPVPTGPTQRVTSTGIAPVEPTFEVGCVVVAVAAGATLFLLVTRSRRRRWWWRHTPPPHSVTTL